MRMVVVVAAGLVLASCARELALVKGEMPVIAGSLEGGHGRSRISTAAASLKMPGLK